MSKKKVVRKIYVSGTIDSDSFKEFCEKLDEYEDESNDPVEIVLNSEGGLALDAIAFAGRIRTSSVEAVNITVFGLCASAAVLVLAAGNVRRMTKESFLMVHEDMNSYEDINTSKIMQEAATSEMLEQHWAMLLEELTGTKREAWRDLHKRGDIYLTPNECLTLGIITEIV